MHSRGRFPSRALWASCCLPACVCLDPAAYTAPHCLPAHPCRAAVPSEEGTARRRLLEAAAAGNAPAFRACPRILSPVCSTDGQQYPNDCVAANRGAQVACRGPCPCGAEASSAGNSAGPVDPVMGPCPKIYSPVCGLDGQTYPSKCVAGGAEAVDCEGPCPCPAAGMRELLADGDGEAQPCTKEYVPVCSVDGETFANRCLAGDAEIAYEGECRAVRPCPAIYAPVCSADNATYGSDCVAEGAGAEVACSGECPCPKPDAKPCPLNWAPVCGVDGATYGNDCAAGDVEIACQGECPCKGDAAEGQSTDGDDAVCMTMVDPVCSMGEGRRRSLPCCGGILPSAASLLAGCFPCKSLLMGPACLPTCLLVQTARHIPTAALPGWRVQWSTARASARALVSVPAGWFRFRARPSCWMEVPGPRSHPFLPPGLGGSTSPDLFSLRKHHC